MAKTLKQKPSQSSSDTNYYLADDTKEPVDQTVAGLTPPPTTPYLDQEGAVVGPNGEPLEKDWGPLYDEQTEREMADNGGHTLPDED